MKKVLLSIVALSMMTIGAVAQSNVHFKNHHLIFNGDLAFGSPYTAAVSSIVTGLANYYLLNDAFFENSFAYSTYSVNTDGVKAKTMNPMGLTARELFNNVQTGIKVGYQTYSPEFVNAGIYASAHYKLDQFQVGIDDDHMTNHRTQRVLVGATVLLSLGSMGQASRVIVEAGCRYSVGLAYKSPLGTDKKQLNDGLVSHFAIKLASRGMMQNVGVYADINHFNLWKDFRPNQKLNNMTFGLTWTITPQQVDER